VIVMTAVLDGPVSRVAYEAGALVAAPPSTSSPFTTTAVVTVSDRSSGGSPSQEACLGSVHPTSSHPV
jgi:hypothetical protein